MSRAVGADSDRLSISLSVLFSETPNSGGTKSRPAFPLTTALQMVSVGLKLQKGNFVQCTMNILNDGVRFGMTSKGAKSLWSRI